MRIDGPDYRHRDLPPAPEPLSDDEVATRAAAVPGATLDDFDALCAHLATMHPSRYLTLIEGVSAVFITGVHPIDDQNVALRLVSLTDRLYDAGIPVVASGSEAGHRLQRRDAGGRVPQEVPAGDVAAAGADDAAGQTRAHHHVVVLDAGAEPKGLGAVDGKAVLGVKALRALVLLIDPEPHALRVRVRRRCCSASVISAAETPAPWLSGSTYIFEISTAGRSGDGPLHIVVVGNAANQHDVADHSAVLAGGEHQRGRDRRGSRRNRACDRFSSMNAAMFSGVTDGGQASGKVRAATSASSGRSACGRGDVDGTAR